jgi:quercetin dioxygenase-like cupin family protein
VRPITHPQDESSVVLDGRPTVQAGEQRFELEARATSVVPTHRQVNLGPPLGPED